MGIAGSVSQRYIGGKKVLQYYHDDIFPIMQDLFGALRITETLGLTVFRVFASLDKGELGLAQQDACYEFFNARQSRFTERIFHCRVEGTDGVVRTGFTFREFFVRIWSFCSLTVGGVARMLFEIFDVDRIDHLQRAHLQTLFCMLYHVDECEDEYVDIYAYTSQGEVTKGTFMDTSRKNTALILPALRFQAALRSRLGGKLAWEALATYRSKAFVTYDSQLETLEEAALAIVRSSEEAFAGRQPHSAEHMMRASSMKIITDMNAITRELKVREQELEEERRLAASQDRARPMRRAWALFESKKDAFTYEEYLTDDIWHRHEDRLELFDLLDAAIEASNQYFEWKDMRDVEVAIGTAADHEARYQDFVAGEEGQALHSLLLLLRGYEYVEKQILDKLAKVRRKSAAEKSEKQALVETAVQDMRRVYGLVCIENELNGAVSAEDRAKQWNLLRARDLREEMKALKKFLVKQDLARTEALVHEELCRDLREKTIELVRREVARNQKQRQVDYQRKDFDLAMTFGSRITRWEFVLEKKTNKNYFMNLDTLALRHPKTSICEHCDAIMIQHEKVCVECLVPRSPKNMTLYRPLGFKDITAE